VGWVVSPTPWPLYPQGTDPLPILRDAWWAPGPLWTGAQNLASTGIRFPERQPVAGRCIQPTVTGMHWLVCLWGFHRT